MRADERRAMCVAHDSGSSTCLARSQRVDGSRSLGLRYLPHTSCKPGEPTEDELEEEARRLHCARPVKASGAAVPDTRGLLALDASVVSTQDSTASAANASGSMAAARASTGGNAGGALVFESKKSSAPRSRLSERSSEGSTSGMWWMGTQTSMEAADKLQAQRSQRRVLVEDGDEGSDDDKVRGVYW